MALVHRSAWSRRVLGLGSVVLIAGTCTSAGSPSAPASVAAAPSSAAGGAITAKESEFKIELSATSAPAGSVSFQITNGGTVVHEFVVMKTDLAADKLPVDSSTGVVSEDTAGLTVVDEVEDLAVGASAPLTVDLPAGHYVIICNVPAHYGGGMHVDFTTT